MRKIRLTESQFHRLVAKCVKKAINEANNALSLNEYDLNDLRSAMIDIDEGARDSECGDWVIARGGYNLAYEFYYNGEAVFQLFDTNELRVVQNKFSNINDAINVILNTWDDVKWHE